MPTSFHKHNITWSVACAALVLTTAGCPEWLRDIVTHRPTPTEPPSSAGSAPTPEAGHAGVPSGDPTVPVLPAAPADCPTIESGVVRVHGVQVRLWAGAPQAGHEAPLLVYWYGTGSSPAEVPTFISPIVDEIVAEGGIVAAPVETTGEGDITSTGTWYTGDYAVIDDLVACIAAQRPLDARRIYTTGCSSGGIEAGGLAFARSNYVAAVSMNSGGLIGRTPLQDPARVPNAISAHGDPTQDIVIVNFAETSLAYDRELVSRGGFAVNCNHGTSHCAAPPALQLAMWEFLKAHPYGIAPDPYANGLPASFPDYCQVIDN